MAVAQGVEKHQLCPGLLQGLEIVGVIKAKGGVAGDGQGHVGRRQGAQHGRRAWFLARRGRQQGVEIDALENGVPRVGDHFVAFARLAWRGQAEMAFVDIQAVSRPRAPSTLEIGVILDRLTQFAFLARAADLVQDDARDFDAAVEIPIAKQQGRDPARHANRVDDQHHRRAQELGQGGAESAPLGIDAVMQPLVAFDQGDIGVCHSRARTGEGFRLGFGC